MAVFSNLNLRILNLRKNYGPFIPFLRLVSEFLKTYSIFTPSIQKTKNLDATGVNEQGIVAVFKA